MQKLLLAFIMVLVATVSESSGDAFVRTGLLNRVGAARIAPLAIGAVLLFVYGCALNLAPLPFHRVVGVYIAMLFVCWQVVSFGAFGTLPSMPALIGGSLIVLGGLIVTFWPAGTH